jgi:hypothetical protein
MFSFSIKRRFGLFLLISGGLFILSASTVFAFEINDTRIFYLDPSYDFQARTQTAATLKKVSDNAYFYIEDEFWQALSPNQQAAYLAAIEDIATQFNEQTYLALRYVFGSEWKPGIDNDEKITIFFTQLKKTAGGYFNEKDEYPASPELISNQREMIYINASQVGGSIVNSLIAHELQHLISWNQKRRINAAEEEVWLNELRSEYASTVAGLDSEYVGSNLERRVEDFLVNPFESLTEWNNDKYDYPPVNLFGHYLAEQFSENVFSLMMKNNKIGISSIEQALRDEGYNYSFSQIFNNWAIASYLNDPALANGIYSYKNPYLRGNVKVSPITYSIVSASVINIAQQVKDWAPYWYRFVNKQDANAVAKDLEIEFEGSTNRGNFNVFYIINYFNQSPVIGFLNLENQVALLKIPDFKTKIESVTIIISNQFKKSDFQINQTSSPFILSVATTVFQGLVNPPQANPQPGPGETQPKNMAKPSDFGLKEGDLIRAQGDFDIFIINQYGYKRLFLNPIIFNMYGHLTGGWKAVKTVTPQVRDAFITSNYYRYIESPKVYELEVTGEDTGKLHWLNITAEQFLAGAKAESIFTINKSEFNWYPKGADVTTL